MTVVCGIKENIEFACQRVTPNQHHWDTVLPKITHFWRFCGDVRALVHSET